MRLRPAATASRVGLEILIGNSKPSLVLYNPILIHIFLLRGRIQQKAKPYILHF
jgi:hypothetical protein